MRSDQIQDTANGIFWSETEKEGTDDSRVF